MSQTLYRMFDYSGALLYVGVSSNPGRRFARHAADKDWWREIASITTEHFDTRDDVLRAERRAIINEHPRHNIVHNRAAQTTPTPTPRRWARFEPPEAFTPGNVIAVAATGRRVPPVGQVVECTPTTLILAPYAWGIGYFDHDGPLGVPLISVMSFRLAKRMDPAIAVELGYLATDLVWDMDPLAAFQDEWTPRGLTSSEVGRIKQLLADPDHRGQVLP